MIWLYALQYHIIISDKFCWDQMISVTIFDEER